MKYLKRIAACNQSTKSDRLYFIAYFCVDVIIILWWVKKLPTFGPIIPSRPSRPMLEIRMAINRKRHIAKHLTAIPLICLSNVHDTLLFAVLRILYKQHLVWKLFIDTKARLLQRASRNCLANSYTVII